MISLPASANSDSRSAKPDTLAKNIVLLNEAEGISRILDQLHIRVIFLKGIALLDDAVKDLSSREMVDIDLLVAPADLSKLAEALTKRGYVPTRNALVHEMRLGAFSLQIDIHTDLWWYSNNNYWERSRLKANEGGMRVLCPEDSLLVCMLHSLVQDGVVTEKAVGDCKAITSAYHNRIDWKQFVRTVEAEGWELPVAYFIGILRQTAPDLIPEEVTFEGLPRFPWSRAHTWRAYYRMLRMNSSVRARIRLMRRILFPDRFFLRMRYPWFPAPLAFLLPIFRPILLLGDGIYCRLSDRPG